MSAFTSFDDDDEFDSLLSGSASVGARSSVGTGGGLSSISASSSRSSNGSAKRKSISNLKVDDFDIDVASFRKENTRPKSQFKKRKLGETGNNGSPALSSSLMSDVLMKDEKGEEGVWKSSRSGKDEEFGDPFGDPLDLFGRETGDDASRSSKTSRAHTSSAESKPLSVTAFPRWSLELQKLLPRVYTHKLEADGVTRVWISKTEHTEGASLPPGCQSDLDLLEIDALSKHMAADADFLPTKWMCQLLFTAAAYCTDVDASENAHCLLLDVVHACARQKIDVERDGFAWMPSKEAIVDVFANYGFGPKGEETVTEVSTARPAFPSHGLVHVLELTQEIIRARPSHFVVSHLLTLMPKLTTLVCDTSLDVSLVNMAWSTMGQIFRFCEEHDNKRKLECQLLGEAVTLDVTIKKRHPQEDNSRAKKSRNALQTKLTSFFKRNPTTQATDPKTLQEHPLLSTGKAVTRTIMNVNARYCESLHKLARILASDEVTSDLATKVQLISKAPFLDEYSRNVVRVAAFMALEAELTGDRSLLQSDWKVDRPANACTIKHVNLIVALASRVGNGYTRHLSKAHFRAQTGDAKLLEVQRMVNIVTLEDLACGSYDQIMYERDEFERVHARWEALKHSLSGHSAATLALQPTLVNIMIKYLHSDAISSHSGPA